MKLKASLVQYDKTNYFSFLVETSLGLRRTVFNEVTRKVIGALSIEGSYYYPLTPESTALVNLPVEYFTERKPDEV